MRSNWKQNRVGGLWDTGNDFFLVLDADYRDVFTLRIKLHTYYLCTVGVQIIIQPKGQKTKMQIAFNTALYLCKGKYILC